MPRLRYMYCASAGRHVLYALVYMVVFCCPATQLHGVVTAAEAW